MKPFNLFPYDSKIDFMRMRWVSLAVAALLVLTSIGAILYHTFPGGRFEPMGTFNYAIDFTGGAAVELRTGRPASVERVRQRLADAGFDSAQVQTLGTSSELIVRLQPSAADTAQATEASGMQSIGERVRTALGTEWGEVSVLRSEQVGAQVGSELAAQGIWALIFVIVGFLVYISFRFEFKFALAATLTTMHDVILVLGWFAISRHDFDLTVLAGVLSVLGFSINDTIVVFDRIRDNFRGMRASPIEVLNVSINQTLSRTVITSFAAFLTVLALYLYGGGSLRGMAEAQLIGVVIGTFSTIFLACPLLLKFGVSKQDLLPKARDEEALARRP
ncbi:MAG: protein translocase subunit SecF [Pseudomonadota bacterium]